MSTALRSAVPFSASAPRPSALIRRLGAVPSLHAGAAALVMLVGGLLLSIATTSDPLWWRLHFSQLGIFGDFSSAVFNSTLKVSGLVVVLFAFCVRRDVRAMGRGPARRGSATLAGVCYSMVGVNLALVGCIPLNTDKDLHDRVAALMVLGFLALIVCAPFVFHRLGVVMTLSTVVAIAWLVASIALFVTATINLALFETISCSAMFAWSGVFTWTLRARALPTKPDAAAPAATAHAVPRRPRRPLLAGRSSAARPASARRPLSARPSRAPFATAAHTYEPLAGTRSARPRTAPASRTGEGSSMSIRPGGGIPPTTGAPVRDPRVPVATSASGPRGRRAETAPPIARTIDPPLPRTSAGRRAADAPSCRPPRRRGGLVSASRAARGGSADARRRSTSGPGRSAAPPASRDGARSLLR
jgi:hypothetical membrane protein